MLDRCKLLPRSGSAAHAAVGGSWHAESFDQIASQTLTKGLLAPAILGVDERLAPILDAGCCHCL